MLIQFEAIYMGSNTLTSKNGDAFTIVNFFGDDGQSNGFIANDIEKVKSLEQLKKYKVSADYNSYAGKTFVKVLDFVKMA